MSKQSIVYLMSGSCEPEGRVFESFRAHQININKSVTYSRRAKMRLACPQPRPTAGEEASFLRRRDNDTAAREPLRQSGIRVSFSRKSPARQNRQRRAQYLSVIWRPDEPANTMRPSGDSTLRASAEKEPSLAGGPSTVTLSPGFIEFFPAFLKQHRNGSQFEFQLTMLSSAPCIST